MVDRREPGRDKEIGKSRATDAARRIYLTVGEDTSYGSPERYAFNDQKALIKAKAQKEETESFGSRTSRHGGASSFDMGHSHAIPLPRASASDDQRIIMVEGKILDHTSEIAGYEEVAEELEEQIGELSSGLSTVFSYEEKWRKTSKALDYVGKKAFDPDVPVFDGADFKRTMFGAMERQASGLLLPGTPRLQQGFRRTEQKTEELGRESLLEIVQNGIEDRESKNAIHQSGELYALIGNTSAARDAIDQIRRGGKPFNATEIAAIIGDISLAEYGIERWKKRGDFCSAGILAAFIGDISTAEEGLQKGPNNYGYRGQIAAIIGKRDLAQQYLDADMEGRHFHSAGKIASFLGNVQVAAHCIKQTQREGYHFLDASIAASLIWTQNRERS